MAITIECPQFIYQSFDVLAGDELEITLRLGNNRKATILVVDGTDNILYQTSGESGQHIFNHIVRKDGSIIVKVYPESEEIIVNEILLCLKQMKSCDTDRIRNLRAFIEYEGTPRQPLNIFNAFARVTFRNGNLRTVKNLRVLNTARSSLPVPNICSQQGVCDFWKTQLQQNNVLSNQLSDFAIASASKNGQVNIALKTNWLWSIPASSKPIGQDFVQAGLMDSTTDPLVGVVESIEIYLLANKITFEAPISQAQCNSYCSPDPAQSIGITIVYDRDTRGLTLQKSFTLFLDIKDVYEIIVPADDTPLLAWDELITFGNGISGYGRQYMAKWNVIAFQLDKTNGKGLDQCTEPQVPAINTGSGNLSLIVPRIDGVGFFQSKCDATIELVTLQQGSRQDRVVSITLPPSTGGTWTISMLVGSELQTSSDIPYNATPEELKEALISIPYIGYDYNLRVSGAVGFYSIEFVGELAGGPHPDFITNADDLEGAASYSVTRIQSGTNNDIQEISRVSTAITAPFTLEVLGQISESIRYNVSLNELTGIIGDIEAVGAENVSVSGNAFSGTADFTGPWLVEFINTLGATEIALMRPSFFGYVVEKISTGGIGLNEKHEIKYRCTGGAFSLTFRNPTDETMVETIGGIPFDVDDIDLFNLIITSISWITSADINVTLVQDEDLRTFVIEYIGDYEKQRMPIPAMNADNLIGGQININTIAVGSGIPEITRMTINKARGGSYRLVVNGNQTTSIPYNSTPEGIRSQLKQLPTLRFSNVSVTQSNNIYTIYTGVQAGNITMSAIFETTLLCDPLFLPPVPEPDYPYPIPDCDEQYEDYSLMFKGALFCDPGEPYPEPPIVPGVLEPAANKSAQLDYQRDLLPADININGIKPTIKQIAVIKKISQNDYDPYIRKTGVLELINWSYVPQNQDSIIFIHKGITDLNRVLTGIAKSEILPSRMKWPIG